jgi:hypothetical protein
MNAPFVAENKRRLYEYYKYNSDCFPLPSSAVGTVLTCKQNHSYSKMGWNLEERKKDERNHFQSALEEASAFEKLKGLLINPEHRKVVTEQEL